VSTLVGLTGIALITRFGYRIFVAKLDLGLDDWFILAATLCIIPSHIVTEAGTVPNGLGKDLWTLTPSQITSFGYYFWIMAWIYFLEIALTKLSMLFFYLRIFPSQSAQRVLWATVAFTTAYGIAFVTTCLFQCWPVSYNWTKWDRQHQGQCININAFTWSHAVMSICLDFWMLAVPLWQIKSLQMNLKKKIGVGLMLVLPFHHTKTN
jgi:hypothetical protein